VLRQWIIGGFSQFVHKKHTILKLICKSVLV
jgi:hypothetical protein